MTHRLELLLKKENNGVYINAELMIIETVTWYAVFDWQPSVYIKYYFISLNIKRQKQLFICIWLEHCKQKTILKVNNFSNSLNYFCVETIIQCTGLYLSMSFCLIYYNRSRKRKRERRKKEKKRKIKVK
jgi:hypothetical protein